ncbi:hypothetical protein [Haloprofundus salinisoli]|nr:hypothetical protein [Haloprofundus salinisoli]
MRSKRDSRDAAVETPQSGATVETTTFQMPAAPSDRESAPRDGTRLLR